MPGRTHGQHALPITFGFKTAVWLDEVRRHAHRLAQCKPRVLVGQFGGAVGTLAGVAEHGLEIRRRMMARLGLAEPTLHGTWPTMALPSSPTWLRCWQALAARWRTK